MFKKNMGRFNRKTRIIVALALFPVAVLLMSGCRKKGCPASSSASCPCSGS